MKKLIQNIQEKLVFNKHTKEKKHIKVDVDKSSLFTEKEIDEITKYCYELPVLPDEITNLKIKENGRLFTRIKINFYNQDNSNYNKRIVFNKEKNITNEYDFCVILRIKTNNINYILPDDHQIDKGEYYKNIKECINGLKTFNMIDDFLKQ